MKRHTLLLVAATTLLLLSSATARRGTPTLPRAVWASPIPRGGVHIGRQFGPRKGWRRVLNYLRRQMDVTKKEWKASGRGEPRFVYLSGPISTGGKGSMKANLKYGHAVTRRLEKAGYAVISPFDVERARTDPEIFDALNRRDRLAVETAHSWKDDHFTFMTIWSNLLKGNERIERIVVLPGYETSTGASQEMNWFRSEGKQVQRFREAETGRGFELVDMPYHRVLSRTTHRPAKVQDVTDARHHARFARQAQLRAVAVPSKHTRAAIEEVATGATIVRAVVESSNFASQLNSTRTALRDAIAAFDASTDFVRNRAIEIEVTLPKDDLARGMAAAKRGNTLSALHAYNSLREKAQRLTIAAKNAASSKASARVIIHLDGEKLTQREAEIAAGVLRTTWIYGLRFSGKLKKGVRRALKRIAGASRLVETDAVGDDVVIDDVVSHDLHHHMDLVSAAFHVANDD